MRVPSPRTRRRLAWLLALASLVAWPLTALTVARSEPQVVLALSWLAITFTIVDLIHTADVRVQQEEDA